MSENVILGLSGGVDSAVAACILKSSGYAVSGVFLDNGLPDAPLPAQETADALGIPLEIVDIRAELEKNVCAPFAEAYQRGETPNPCVMCNPAVKFRALCAAADRAGAGHIATGHYARTENGRLLRGAASNDQSYMLCRLTRDQVSRLLLPLGGYEKSAVRAMAAELGLAAASRPDSMEICFIPDNDYISWLERRGIAPPPGDIVFGGEVVGRHDGVHRWTVGQRLPGLYGGEKLYVSRLCAESAQVEVERGDALFKTRLRVRNMNWLIAAPLSPVTGSVKVRHTRSDEQPCTVTPTPDGGAEICCITPVRAPAPGQSAVIYSGETVLGGGYIV